MINASHPSRTALSIVVIVLGFNLGFYWFRAVTQETTHPQALTESGRNEHTTPRNFILPATPAVATEQELRSADTPIGTRLRREIATCAIKLIDLGYDVGDEPVVFNAKLAEALYEYQSSHHLTKTGKLDISTMRSLSCMVN